MENLKNNISKKSKRLLHLSTEKGVSNCLTKLPITEYGFELWKQHFWILSVKGMAEKFQSYQQCFHVEVDLTYSIVWVTKKEDL